MKMKKYFAETEMLDFSHPDLMTLVQGNKRNKKQ